MGIARSADRRMRMRRNADGPCLQLGRRARERLRDVREGRRARAGQMTVQLAVAMPVLIVVALIAVNGCSFIADCAVFDRVAHEAIRVHAPSPAYRQTKAQSCSLIEQEIRSAIDEKNVKVSVTCASEALDFERFTATLEYSPTLFGIGMRASIFGVELPRATHSTSLVVDVYKPGVIV